VILVTVLMLYLGQGLYSLAWGMVARALFAALAGAAIAYRVCIGEMGIAPRLQAVEARRLTTDSSRLFVVSLAMKLLTRSDVFFVGIALGGSAAAVYGITTRCIDTVSMLVSQLTTALLPGMAHLYGEGNLARFRDLLQRISPVVCALALAGLATAAALDRDFVTLWVGPGLFGGAPIAFAFAGAAFISAVGFVAYDVLIAAGRFEFIAYTFTLFATLQIPVMVLLLRWLGMVGAPVAAMLSSLGWCLVLWSHVPDALAPQVASFAAPGRAVAVALIVVSSVIWFGAWMLPAAHSWLHLGGSAVSVLATMIGGILLASRTIREAVRIEVLATLGAFGRRSRWP
jgi:O-antigen/teichoic acid export membrane protein